MFTPLEPVTQLEDLGVKRVDTLPRQREESMEYDTKRSNSWYRLPSKNKVV